jgi:fido (protein-threonine AMPylation protein)
MVTKYDLFLELADTNTPIKTSGFVKTFKKKNYEYPNIYRMLKDLVKKKLAINTKQGFQIKLSPRSRLLYRLITYCVANGINYNYLLDKELARFIAKALLKIEFNSKDFKIDPKTFHKYTKILIKYELIIKISAKPFRARIVWNHLLSNLLQYFGIPPIVKKEKDVDFLDRLRKELMIFNKRVKKNEKAYNELIRPLEIKFIHSSLSLEGNPITLPNTIKILKDKIIPKDLKALDVKETQNYYSALKFALRDAINIKKLNKEKILSYHFLAMQHREEIAGRIRDVSVYIKGNSSFKVAKLKDIDKLLNKLLVEYNVFIKKKHTIKELVNFVSYFHNQFQFIHPFVDGNSRITRLLMFHILHYMKIPILFIPLGLLDQYLSNTKGYKVRDDGALVNTLQLIVLCNLKTINDKLGEF